MRVRGYGFDVVLDRGRYSTRRHIPEGSCAAQHNEAEAAQLLADLYRLARYETPSPAEQSP